MRANARHRSPEKCCRYSLAISSQESTFPASKSDRGIRQYGIDSA